MGMAQPRGVLVERVISGSAASKVLRAGDVLLEAHGAAVNTPADFDATAAKVASGKVVRLLVVRDGRTLFVGLRL